MAPKRRDHHASAQPGLFDRTTIELPATKKAELTMLLEQLLAEIAQSLAKREAGDEQDHR